MPYTYILQDLGIDIICFICEKSKFGCLIFTHMGLIVFNYKVHLHCFSTVKKKLITLPLNCFFFINILGYPSLFVIPGKIVQQLSEAREHTIAWNTIKCSMNCQKSIRVAYKVFFKHSTCLFDQRFCATSQTLLIKNSRVFYIYPFSIVEQISEQNIIINCKYTQRTKS